MTYFPGIIIAVAIWFMPLTVRMTMGDGAVSLGPPILVLVYALSCFLVHLRYRPVLSLKWNLIYLSASALLNWLAMDANPLNAVLTGNFAAYIMWIYFHNKPSAAVVG